MRDGRVRRVFKVMARQSAAGLAIALVLVFVLASLTTVSGGTASAQEEDPGGYEPLSSQDETEQTTESVVDDLADGRDESTTAVEGDSGMESTEPTAATDEPGLSESSSSQEQTESEAPLPEASPGPPLTESTAPATTTMEPTSPTPPATGQYEGTNPLPGATPQSGGLSTTALVVAPLLLGIALIGTALLSRSRSERGAELSGDDSTPD